MYLGSFWQTMSISYQNSLTDYTHALKTDVLQLYILLWTRQDGLVIMYMPITVGVIALSVCICCT